MGQALSMTGKLDDISFALGELKAQGVAFLRAQEENRRIAETRHAENTEKLRSIDTRVGQCETSMSTMNSIVQTMKPVVDSLTMTRAKFGGAVALGTAFFVFVGWLVSLFAKGIVSWVLSLLGKG
jgi:hypothetical protein